MATSGTLSRLIRELRGVTSPLDRMRVVARAWRSLRRLKPDERKILNVVEEMALASGTPLAIAPAMNCWRCLAMFLDVIMSTGSPGWSLVLRM